MDYQNAVKQVAEALLHGDGAAARRVLDQLQTKEMQRSVAEGAIDSLSGREQLAAQIMLAPYMQ